MYISVKRFSFKDFINTTKVMTISIFDLKCYIFFFFIVFVNPIFSYFFIITSVFWIMCFNVTFYYDDSVLLCFWLVSLCCYTQHNDQFVTHMPLCRFYTFFHILQIVYELCLTLTFYIKHQELGKLL